MYKKIREVPCWSGSGKKSLWATKDKKFAVLIKAGENTIHVIPFYHRRKQETLFFGKEFCRVIAKIVKNL